MMLRAVGCQTCRSRRIKCDRTQPTCQKCLKSGRVCRGFSDGTPVLHSENAYASGKQKRPRGPRSAALITLPAGTDPIPRQLELDLENLALSYYLSRHLRSLTGAPNLVRGIPDAVSPNWTAHSALPVLRRAVSALALTIFSRTQHHPRASLEGSQRYLQVLRTAQNTFRAVEEDSIDASLLVIFFMSRYEDAIHVDHGPRPTLPAPLKLLSAYHHDGALATLDLWKNHVTHTRPPSDIIKLTRRGLLRSAILRSLALPGWIQDGASFGESSLELEYDRIVVRIISVRRRLFDLLGGGDSLQGALPSTVLLLQDISEEAKSIDVALQKWVIHFPESWSYQQHVLPQPTDYPNEDHYSSLLYTYSSYAHAAVWNLYYAMRMLINNTRLKIPHLAHSNMTDNFSEYHADCASIMEAMANALAASIPYCLQRVSSAQNIGMNNSDKTAPYIGSLAVWPLTVASSLTFLKGRKKAWFRAQLSRFGQEAGYGVLASADVQDRLEL